MVVKAVYQSLTARRTFNQTRFWGIPTRVEDGRPGWDERYRSTRKSPVSAARAAGLRFMTGDTVGGLRVLTDLFMDSLRFWDLQTTLWLLTQQAVRSRGGRPILPDRPAVSTVDAYLAAVLPDTEEGIRTAIGQAMSGEEGRHPREWAIMLFNCARSGDKAGVLHLLSKLYAGDRTIAESRFYLLALVESSLILTSNLSWRTHPPVIADDQVRRILAILNPSIPMPPYTPMFTPTPEWDNRPNEHQKDDATGPGAADRGTTS